MRYWLCLLFLLVSLLGCGPKLSRQDLGIVVFEIPKVAGADKPYPLPEWFTPTESGHEHDSHSGQHLP
jgi:hypothetical protein